MDVRIGIVTISDRASQGVYEDHVRYAMTFEEWKAKEPELTTEWLVPHA